MNRDNTLTINTLNSPFVRCSWEKNNNNFKLDYSAGKLRISNSTDGNELMHCHVTGNRRGLDDAWTTINAAVDSNTSNPSLTPWKTTRRIRRSSTNVGNDLLSSHESETSARTQKTNSWRRNSNTDQLRQRWKHCSTSFAIKLASQSFGMTNYQISAAQLLLKSISRQPSCRKQRSITLRETRPYSWKLQRWMFLNCQKWCKFWRHFHGDKLHNSSINTKLHGVLSQLHHNNK